MPQANIMTLNEKLAIAMKGVELSDAGKEDESVRYMIENFPLPTYLAKFVKKHYGAKFLIDGHFNLSEVEAELGPDWICV